MSRSDEELVSAVEGLLQKYEREEAVVLRAELVEFLKSEACRAQIEQAVRKPVEGIVLAALSDPKFQEQVRNTVITSLKPEITAAVQSAMKDVKVTIPPETHAQMRRDADEVVRSAHAAAQRDALAASHHRLGSMSPTDKLVLGGVVAVVLVVAGFVFLISRHNDPRGTTVIPAVTEITPPSFEPTTTTPQPSNSRLFEAYRTALDQAGPANLPQPSATEIACVDDAIRQVNQAPLDVDRLRTLLNGCTPLSAKPTTASRIVAGVQAQLTEEARAGMCQGLKSVTDDGLHGNKTSEALTAYVGCRGPLGVPRRLETLGDYATVGVYFIDKRMRDPVDDLR